MKQPAHKQLSIEKPLACSQGHTEHTLYDILPSAVSPLIKCCLVRPSTGSPYGQRPAACQQHPGDWASWVHLLPSHSTNSGPEAQPLCRKSQHQQSVQASCSLRRSCTAPITAHKAAI